jgi:hypothetical protein
VLRWRFTDKQPLPKRLLVGNPIDIYLQGKFSLPPMSFDTAIHHKAA